MRNHKLCECEIDQSNRRKSVVNYFDRCLSISVVKINPETDEIDTNMSNNTKTEVWLEFGRAFIDYNTTDSVIFEHDYRLDCEGDTFEEAIIKLANLVDQFYYDNGEDILKITEV